MHTGQGSYPDEEHYNGNNSPNNNKMTSFVDKNTHKLQIKLTSMDLLHQQDMVIMDINYILMFLKLVL
jgi:hypothetical protein